MDWTKLKTDECPHCFAQLEDKGGEMRCCRCTFHIEYKRYKQIRAVRSREKGDKPMKWQNLKTGKCPMCSSMLREYGYGMQRCMKIECPFKIEDDRIEIMLADPTHPVNKYSNE